MSIDLDAIEARARAATEGPWIVERCGMDDTAELIGADNRKVADLPFYAPHRHVGNEEFLRHARQDVIALATELRHLRASSLPARVTLPTGTVAEVVSVRVRRATPTGGTWHESMSVERWRRQGNVREELRDSGGGGDREV